MKKILFAIILMLSSIATFSQNISVSGKVTNDNGDAVIGAIVLENNTMNAVRTDADGNYKIEIDASHVPTVLIIRSIGFGSKELSIDGSNTDISFNPVLGTNANSINEVVVSASKKSEKVLDAPASVSVLSEARITENTSLAVVDNLRKVAAVDIMPTGLVSNNVIVRGFNNIFSGSMMYVVDNRLASVPSLRVNAFQLVPTSNTDISSMEVVRGPASALYGPFASNGVLAVYTKSPLDMENRMEMTLGLTTGIRAGDKDMPEYGFTKDNSLKNIGILSTDFRVAGKLSKRFGIKVSSNITKANDFAYFDSREPNGKKVRFGNQASGKPWESDGSAPREFHRNFEIDKIAFDGRADWQVADDAKFDFGAGYSQNTNMELTGLGAAQAVDWTSNYFQTRFMYKRLFVQYYINSTNSGNTYLIPQSTTQTNFTYLKENSKFHSAQIQNSNKLFDNLIDLTYGFDAYLTRPKGNVYGRFDGGDANINQYGAYAQSTFDFSKQWQVTTALRVDYQDVIKEWMLSPRAAIVFKPEENHTLRATYNRAFNAPSALNFFLDINNGTLNPITGSSIRAFGNASGINYAAGTDGLPSVTTAGGQVIPYTAASNSALIPNVMAGIGQVIAAQMMQNGAPASSAQASAQLLLNGIQPTELSPVNIVSGKKVAATDITNKKSVESTVTQTAEIGYKGFLMKKLSLGVDLYYTHIKNFVSPLTNATYQIAVNPEYYQTPAVQAQMLANINAAGPYRDVLVQALTGNASASNAEIIKAYTTQLIRAGAVANTGSIVADNTNTGQDVILTYFNVGNVGMFGTDFSFSLLANKYVKVEGAFSYMSKDKFEVVGATDGYVSLNAPKYKSALNAEFKLPVDNHSLALRFGWRWLDAFDANSAVYIGRVDAANILDAGISWQPSKSPSTMLTFNVNNVLNYRHAFFPGTPAMGTVALLKLQHTFGVK